MKQGIGARKAYRMSISGDSLSPVKRMIRPRRLPAIFWWLSLVALMPTGHLYGEAPRKGVILVDGLWIFQKAEEGLGHIGVLNTGDEVTIGGKRDGQLKILAGDGYAWVEPPVLVQLDADVAAEELLCFAHGYFNDRQYPQALALYHQLLNHFPNSRYAPQVLLQYGQTAEAIAQNETRKLSERVESKEVEPAARGSPENLSIGAYARWGLELAFQRAKGYYYEGRAYGEILKRFPETRWADDAQYRLNSLARREAEWDERPDEPLSELELWEGFLKRYPRSNLLPEALLEVGYLCRILHEVYSESHIPEVLDGKMAEQFSKRAETTFRRVIKDYPDTIYSAMAEVNLSELKAGRNIHIRDSGK